MTKDTVEMLLTGLLAVHQEKLETLALRVRDHIVEPFCKRTGYTFTQGMGTFFFSKNGKNYSAAYELPRGKIGLEMAGIFEVLNLQTSRNQVLGYLVEDVS